MANMPSVDVTTIASTKMHEILNSEEMSGKGVRIYVEGGGCSGFQYGFAFDDPRDTDFRLPMKEGFEVLVDTFSMDYLRGSQVDFVDTIEGSGFKISNPNATGTCGCGSSFSA
ncbi:MAG: iron-sulfur cluster insertion protein ErpA [Gemmatimonadota bacterium]|nr:MAG: iron-sulfur cluster insertion protein ErpA [Gemmatimonadota bacterium]